MSMIRLRPTRIVPNRDDIHYHIEQIFDRLYERLRAFEPECYDDDFGDDLGSLIDADISFRSSPAADEDYDSEASSASDPDYEYKRYPSSQLEDYGIDDEIIPSDSRVIDGPHPQQYPRSEISDTTDEGSYGNGSYERVIEPGIDTQEDGLGLSLPSSRMNYGELTRASHSLDGHRRSFGRRVASGTYQHHESMHSLFSIRQINPRLLFAFPEYSIQFPEIQVCLLSSLFHITFLSLTQRQHDIVSLRSLFASLSLNTLPGLDQIRLGEKEKGLLYQRVSMSNANVLYREPTNSAFRQRNGLETRLWFRLEARLFQRSEDSISTTRAFNPSNFSQSSSQQDAWIDSRRTKYVPD